MKFILKKYIKKVHLWLGLCSGLIVFIIAITGSIYVFSEDIKNIIYKDRRYIEVPKNSKRLPISQLLTTAEEAFDNKYTFHNIIIPNYPNRSVSIMFEEINENTLGYPKYMEFYKTVYLNPYTGKIIKIEDTKWEFFNVILWIHISLFLGYNSLSNSIIIIASWIFVIMLLTGLFLWWPKKSQRKQSFSFKWKATTRWRRKNYDLHRILGFYFFTIALISVLTGLFWASPGFNNTIKWIANGGQITTEESLPKAYHKKVSISPLEDILSKTLKNIPQSKYILIRKHPNKEIPYIVRSYTNKTLNFTRIEMLYDRKSATLISEQSFSDKNNGEKIQALNYDLHVGSIGGWATKILTFLMSLVIASLPFTGFMIWFGKSNKRNSKRNKNS